MINEIEGLDPEPIKTPSNVTVEERKAIKELKENKNIVIKKADKTNIFVVMDTEFYRDKLVLKDHLNTPTYEKTSADADKKVFVEQTKLMKNHEQCLTPKEFKFVTNYEWKTSNFYVNPKVAKCKEIKEKMQKNDSNYLKMSPPESLKGRPIIAGPTSPTKHLSKLIGKILGPLVPLQESYVKDDLDFIKQLPRQLDYEAVLFTCDIVSLYTSIPHDLGVEAIDYWIQHHRDKIADRFTRNFIIESIIFILKNNNFHFDRNYFHQLDGTGMGVDFAGNYACLCIGYLEKVKLFGLHITSRFIPEDISLIMIAFLRYVDDGFMFWPAHLDVNVFVQLLSMLHPKIHYTIDKGLIENGSQSINFLDVKITLHNGKRIETELYYKETNNHCYLEYDSFHPDHVKDDIPYSFFKKIIVFTSDSKKEKIETNKMRNWLYKSGYPKHIVDRKLHNARLQGPSNDPKMKKEKIPFVTQNCSNYSTKSVVKKFNLLVENCPDDNTKSFFKDKSIIQGLRQPKNILRQLTSARFVTDIPPSKPNGNCKCVDKRCKICAQYLVECNEVIGSNGVIWKIPSHITCQSKMVLYFLVCSGCNRYSNVGKTNVLRKRTNLHISSCKSGNTSDKFDIHVFTCKKDHLEPLFKLYVLMEVDNYNKLLIYEHFFHAQGFDVCNKNKATAKV